MFIGFGISVCDVYHNQLAMGRKLRVFAIIDTFSRFLPEPEPRFTFRSADVVEVAPVYSKLFQWAV